MYRILGESETYKELSIDPTHTFRNKLEVLVEKGYEMKILNKKERCYLTPLAPRIPTMYFIFYPIHPLAAPL